MTKKTVKLNTFFFEILNLIIIDDEKINNGNPINTYPPYLIEG